MIAMNHRMNLLEDLDELYIQLLANNGWVVPEVKTAGGVCSVRLAKGWTFLFQHADDRRTFAMQIVTPGEERKNVHLLKHDDYPALQQILDNAGV